MTTMQALILYAGFDMGMLMLLALMTAYARWALNEWAVATAAEGNAEQKAKERKDGIRE